MIKTAGILLFLALVAVSTEVLATPDSVFGITLGKPFSVPECAKYSKTETYKPLKKTFCFEWPLKKGIKTVSGTVLINFPMRENKPIIVKRGQSLKGVVLDGQFEGVEITTDGFSNQDEVLKILEEKYGPSNSFSSKTIEHGLTVKKTENTFTKYKVVPKSIKVFSARWRLENIIVIFSSVTNLLDSRSTDIDISSLIDTDTGLIIIETKIGHRWRIKNSKELTRGRREL